MVVFRNLDCLSFFVYSNTTLLELLNFHCLFYQKLRFQIGGQLIYGYGLYTDIFSTLPLTHHTPDNEIIAMKSAKIYNSTVILYIVC